MEIHEETGPIDFMIEIAPRLKARVKAMKDANVSQVDLAARIGISPQRLNNYINRSGNLPDVEVLARMAVALGVTTDWLLGLNEGDPVDYAAIVRRFLELGAIDPVLADTIVEGVVEAARIAAALPNEGGSALRSRLAAQTVWQSRAGLRPN